MIRTGIELVRAILFLSCAQQIHLSIHMQRVGKENRQGKNYYIIIIQMISPGSNHHRFGQTHTIRSVTTAPAAAAVAPAAFVFAGDSIGEFGDDMHRTSINIPRRRR